MMDHELEKQFAELLAKDRKVRDLAVVMQPLDITHVVQKQFDIIPRQAIKVVAHLLNCCKLESKLQEWAKQNGIEEIGTQMYEPMEYPTPSMIREPNKEKDFEDMISGIKKEVGYPAGGPPGAEFNSNEFPPNVMNFGGNDWPYDLDRQKISQKRGLGLSELGEPSRKTDTKPGFSIYLAGVSNKLSSGDGDESGLGATINTIGKKGWSRSLGTYDLPEVLDDRKITKKRGRLISEKTKEILVGLSKNSMQLGACIDYRGYGPGQRRK